MATIGFRHLNADEVECRVSQIVEGKGLFLLLYKDARCDMRILDEAVGPESWQREPFECKGNLYCRVGIKCGDEWVWKADCGTESNTEAEKGESSDAFKRACVNWGIGRELYSAPKIWIPASKCNIKKNAKGRLVCYDEFDVAEMGVKDGKISSLTISSNGDAVFQWPIKPKNATRDQMDAIHEVADSLDSVCGKTAAQWITAALDSNAAKAAGVESGKELTEYQACEVLGQLRVWADKMAAEIEAKNLAEEEIPF